MKTDELKKLLEATGTWVADISDPTDCVVVTADGDLVANIGSDRVQPLMVAFDCDATNARLIAAAPDLAREVIALREAAGEFVRAVERAKLHQYPATQEALATLRTVLGESE
jgi:hypothetical protein